MFSVGRMFIKFNKKFSLNRGFFGFCEGFLLKRSGGGGGGEVSKEGLIYQYAWQKNGR